MNTAPASCTGSFVVGAQHRAARMSAVVVTWPSPANHQRFRDQRADVVARLPRARNIRCLSVRDYCESRPGVFAMRDLPHDLALIQTDRGDGSVGRLNHRESLHGSGLRLLRHRLRESPPAPPRPPRPGVSRVRAGIGESAPAPSPGPALLTTSRPAGASDEIHVGKSLGRAHQTDRREAGGCTRRRKRCESRRSYDAPRPVCSTARGCRASAWPAVPSILLSTGGVKTGPM